MFPQARGAFCGSKIEVNTAGKATGNRVSWMIAELSSSFLGRKYFMKWSYIFAASKTAQTPN